MVSCDDIEKIKVKRISNNIEISKILEKIWIQPETDYTSFQSRNWDQNEKKFSFTNWKKAKITCYVRNNNVVEVSKSVL